MNKARRKELDKASELIAQAQEIVQGAADEEQEYFDGAPENMVESDKYARAEEAAGELIEIADELSEHLDRIETAKYE